MRVVAAVSGGVDSAVALARVADAGHDVTAVHMALTPDPALSRTGSRGCCTIADAHDARRAADVVGVPFYVWDFADTFTQTVVEDFVAEYQAGRTPNPCIRCNEHIKFAALLDRAIALGFDAVATGHYARIVAGPHGPVLRRAVDRAKDQSYVLAVLGADQLRHAMFPLGDSVKDQVRAEAAARGLRVAAKPDSHDICFIPDGDTAGFLRGKLGERPGPIVDEAGAVVGGHDGTYGFTIGQRRGLGVTRPADDGRPRYVLRIEPVSRTVVVGPREHLAVAAVACGSPVYGAVPPAPGQCVSVQLRAHARPLPATVTAAAASGFAVTLDDPASGIAAGQSAVLYDDDLVLGQGTIAATTPAGPRE